MMKTIYIVRHCKAEGQEPDAPLTTEGVLQALRLVETLAGVEIERIISSPYRRAKDSVTPLAQHLNIPIELDERLIERILCQGFNTDWQQHLEISFEDLDYCLAGGESSRTALQRIVSVIDEIRHDSAKTTLLLTHGNLMALLLKYFDDAVGFSDWKSLSNPDIYRLILTQPPQMQRL
jgi:2,3-bisphosphoglycerate-dependent phosphoglycerate mutase